MSNQRQSSDKPQHKQQEQGTPPQAQPGSATRDHAPGQQHQSGPGRDTPQQGGTSAGRDDKPRSPQAQQGSRNR